MKSVKVEGVELRNCSAEELLPALEDASIDLILTDPPYFRTVSESWDREHKSEADFLEWIGWLCSQWRRVLKPNGSLYCFASADRSRKVAARIEVFMRILNVIRWEKPFAQPMKSPDSQLRRYVTASESCIFAEQYGADSTALEGSGYGSACDKARGHVFEPLRQYFREERAKCPPGSFSRDVLRSGKYSSTIEHAFTSSQWALVTPEVYDSMRILGGPGSFPRPYEELRKEYEELRKEYEELRKEYEELRRPFFADRTSRPRVDLWNYQPPPPAPDRHPCEKPVEMLRDIIETSTRPGALVLDCFAGSASTGCAALHTKRRAILCERDPAWYEIGAGNLRDSSAADGLRSRKMAKITGPLFD